MLKGVVLYAKDLAKLTQFYFAMGGQQIGGSEGDFVVIGSSETNLILLQAPEHIASQIVVDDPPSIRSATPFKPIFETPSIDDTLLAVTAAGGIPAPGAMPWKFGRNLVQDVVDPEGNVIQLWQPQ